MTTSLYILQFILSPKEYNKLHARFISKLSSADKFPSPEKLARVYSSQSELSSLIQGEGRLVLRSFALLSLVNIALLKRSGRSVPAARIAAALGLISTVYRVLYGGLSASRDKILGQDNATRKKRKKIVKVLIPMISGLAAGSALSVVPGSAMRTYASVYVFTRAIETVYNYFDDLGYLDFKPRILGSWALFPFAFSQLFYTFIFHPDCSSPAFNRIMLLLAEPHYLPPAPVGFPSEMTWPEPMQVVASVASVSSLSYPKFISTVLYPNTEGLTSLGDEFEAVQVIADLAHPSNATLTGALMHPGNPSEFQTFLEMAFMNFSKVAKYLLPLYAIANCNFLGSKRGNFSATDLLTSLSAVVGNTFRTTTFITMTTASAWAGIGLFQKLLFNKFIPTYRYRLIGFFSGLWAFVDQVSGRTRYMYAVRMAIIAQWNIWVKQGRIRPVKNGDVLLFAMSFAAIMTVFDLSSGSVSGDKLRKMLSWIRSEQYRDVAEPEIKSTVVSYNSEKSGKESKKK